MLKTKTSLHHGLLILLVLLASCAALTGSDFKITDTKTGSGAEAVPGRVAVVQYTGWLYDSDKPNHKGSRFDMSEPGSPFSFPLGAGKVIKGWDEGIDGMKVGGKRTLIIPSDMAYGARGAGDRIPPDATLIFDVELIDVR